MIARKRMFASVVVALILVALLASVAGAQTFWQRFDNILAKSIETTGNIDVDGALNVDGATTLTTLAASSNATFAGTVSASGATLAVAQTLVLVPQTAISLTTGGVLTPTGTLQMVESAGDVTVTLGNVTGGALVTIINSTNHAVTIADTTGQVFSAAAVLGQWDTLTIVGYGNAWHEVARSNN